jgi:hypothetical protein
MWLTITFTAVPPGGAPAGGGGGPPADGGDLPQYDVTVDGGTLYLDLWAAERLTDEAEDGDDPDADPDNGGS